MTERSDDLRCLIWDFGHANQAYGEIGTTSGPRVLHKKAGEKVDAKFAEMWGEIERLIAERDDTRNSLEDMVRQFAHQVVNQGVPALTTGGLAALEHAFSVLGWDDPRPCPECGCQHPGCVQWATCGTPTGDGYKRLCGEHYQAVVSLSAPASSPSPEESE